MQIDKAMSKKRKGLKYIDYIGKNYCRKRFLQIHFNKIKL